MNIVDVAQEKEMLDEVRDLHQGFRTLTPQEHKVFLYVISGLMNKQIADVLNIKEHMLIDTIKWVLHSAQENICMLR